MKKLICNIPFIALKINQLEIMKTDINYSLLPLHFSDEIRSFATRLKWMGLIIFYNKNR